MEKIQFSFEYGKDFLAFDLHTLPYQKISAWEKLSWHGIPPLGFFFNSSMNNRRYSKNKLDWRMFLANRLDMITPYFKRYNKKNFSIIHITRLNIRQVIWNKLKRPELPVYNSLLEFIPNLTWKHVVDPFFPGLSSPKQKMDPIGYCKSSLQQNVLYLQKAEPNVELLVSEWKLNLLVKSDKWDHNQGSPIFLLCNLQR